MAEQLFARHGIQGTPTRRIVEAAGQRNASAVSYHFGSRDGLLRALLARRGGPVDDQRGQQRARLGADPSVVELVGCLIVPYADLLATVEGRAHVRIVAQLRGRFAAWRVASDATTTAHLARVLDELEARAAGDGPVRAERVVGLIMLLTAAVAERARRIDEGAELGLDHDAFVANLTAMCAALVTA